LLGPLPPAQGNLRYVVVAVEYFSKWIEAKPLAIITSATVQKLFWQNIVRHPNNGTQFDAKTFKTFCSQIGTKIYFASVRHPESNGLVERANGIIITGTMKSIFNQPKGKCPDELIKVVWSVAEPPELFQLKCLSPTLEARPHLNRNNTSVPRI
jgi:transposase InsO family protein